MENAIQSCFVQNRPHNAWWIKNSQLLCPPQSAPPFNVHWHVLNSFIIDRSSKALHKPLRHTGFGEPVWKNNETKKKKRNANDNVKVNLNGIYDTVNVYKCKWCNNDCFENWTTCLHRSLENRLQFFPFSTRLSNRERYPFTMAND